MPSRSGAVSSTGIAKPAIDAWRAFAAESLAAAPTWLRDRLDDPAALVQRGEVLFLRPGGAPLPAELRIVRPGIALGAVKPGRFEPSHALALAIGPEGAALVEDLDLGEAEGYLAGETCAAPAGPVGS